MFNSFTASFIRQKQAFSCTERSVKYSNLQYLLRGQTFIPFEPFTAASMKDAVWHKRQDKWRHPSDWQTGLLVSFTTKTFSPLLSTTACGCQPLTERVSSALYSKVEAAGVYCFTVYLLLMSSLKGFAVVLRSLIRPTMASILTSQKNGKPLS